MYRRLCNPSCSWCVRSAGAQQPRDPVHHLIPAAPARVGVGITQRQSHSRRRHPDGAREQSRNRHRAHESLHCRNQRSSGPRLLRSGVSLDAAIADHQYAHGSRPARQRRQADGPGFVNNFSLRQNLTNWGTLAQSRLRQLSERTTNPFSSFNPLHQFAAPARYLAAAASRSQIDRQRAQLRISPKAGECLEHRS